MTKIPIPAAGVIGVARMSPAQASPTCTLCAVVDPAPAAGEIPAPAMR